MQSVSQLVTAAGGVLHRRQLLALGARDRHLTTAIRRGSVARPRRGWYSTWSPDDPRFIAIRVGGRLTGLSALAHLNPWRAGHRMQHVPITVSVPRNAARLRHQPGVRVVYDPPEVQRRGTTWSVDIRDALARALLETDFEGSVALIDWVLHHGVLPWRHLRQVVRGLPANARGVLDWADPRCDSYPESIARTRLRRAGHVVRSQLRLPTAERVDLVVDGAVALEIDGRTHHEGTFERDRRKDLTIAAVGLTPLRVSATMVSTMWAAVQSAVERCQRERTSRGRAVRAPRPRLPSVRSGRGRRRWSALPRSIVSPVAW
jgi:very-short-patch-repair endonuclease